jgi:hypothetical protein
MITFESSQDVVGDGPGVSAAHRCSGVESPQDSGPCATL